MHLAYKAEITGGEVVLSDIARGQLALGYHVTVSAPRPGPLLDVMANAGAETVVTAYTSSYRIDQAYALSRILRRKKIDVIHSHGLLPNIIARMAGAFARTPLVINTDHTTLDLKTAPRRTSALEKLKNCLLAVLDNGTCRYADTIICVSEAVRASGEKRGNPEAKLAVVRNGIDFGQLENIASVDLSGEFQIPENAFRLVSLARLSPVKGLDVLICGMAEIAKKRDDVYLLIVGNGAEEKNLKDLAARLSVRDRVVFTGYRADAPSLLAACDVFCLASRSGEGLPISVLEAMALGKPVLATPHPGTLEALDGSACHETFPFNDSTKFAELALSLADDRARCRRMGECGKTHVAKNFTAARMVAETMDVYAACLKRKRGS